MMFWLSQKFLSPKAFYHSTTRLMRWLRALFVFGFCYGLVGALFFAPADYQQGDGYRIMFVHVPAAFAGMFAYLIMASSAFMFLVFRIKIAAIAMASCARVGAWLTFLALVTGSIWGKPMWGTWWIWDARLTSMLILLFLYFGFIILYDMIDLPEPRDKACAILALVGVINLPIIHYSVVWWNTLHQGPSISQFAKPAIAAPMLYPLLAMIVTFFLFLAIVILTRMRNEILIREMKTQWVKKVLYGYN